MVADRLEGRSGARAFSETTIVLGPWASRSVATSQLYQLMHSHQRVAIIIIYLIKYIIGLQFYVQEEHPRTTRVFWIAVILIRDSIVSRFVSSLIWSRDADDNKRLDYLKLINFNCDNS